jgi:CRISPR-associated endonuclease/helicase Cas3
MPEPLRYLAHKTEDKREQTLLEHLNGVGSLADNFADIFGAGEFARIVGKSHDAGKYSAKFQRKICGENIRVDHSTAGGQLLYNQNKNCFGLIAAYCIMGHHGGLPNGGAAVDSSDEPTLYGRLKKAVEAYDGYSAEFTEQKIEPPNIELSDMFGVAFLTRFLFSALVDADFIDTETFFIGEAAAPRGGMAEIQELYYRLCSYIEPFLNPVKEVSELNAKRTQLLKNCIAAAESDKGLFTLTAPTGSGKTIASLSFALTHAIKHGLRRVIYIVPYNTIIEQNAKVFEEIVGAENILQHHSNINYDGDENDRKRLSAENWDYPLIVTSSVQFFESLFAARTSKCRKLHNIAGSVLIFDEAQMIPQPYLIPCVKAIGELVRNYNCTAVLATATQSSLDRFFEPLIPKEITESPAELYNFLRRTEIQRIDTPLTDAELAERINAHDQVLCIVNTRKQAQQLFSMLQKGDGVFHLSTTMYPEHRTRILTEIRQRLADNLPCRVVSTSMVEAGVDLDFPAIYRERAGLDSIVQAAGRCNRNNKRPLDESIVYVFKSAEHTPPPAQTVFIDAFDIVAPKFEDISSLDAVKAYFDQLFYNKGDSALDSKGIINALNKGIKGFSIPFREIADKVSIIEDDTQSVFCLCEAPELEARLRAGERTRALFREAGKYAVSLRRREVQNMMKLGVIEKVIENDNEILLINEAYYNENYGVELIPQVGMGLFL